MADDAITALLRRAPFSFIGTVEHLGASTMGDVPIDERTAVVQVAQVLHAPKTFANIEGHRVTLQLAADAAPPNVGETSAFFAEGLAFGESVALTEIGRVPLQDVEPHVTAATERGERGAFEPILRQLEGERLREHASSSDAVVVGRVVKLEDAVGPATSEHDPDWWKATLQVDHVESGNVQPGELEVLYPNSLDVRWAAVPKPKASQGGVWLLHATEGKLRDAAPFQILHPDDYQPVQQLDAIRATGS
jgi:hypothetical protein